MLVRALASPHAHNTAHGVFSSWFGVELSSFWGKCFVRLVFALVLGGSFFRCSFSYAFLVRFFKRLVSARVFGQVFVVSVFHGRAVSGL